MIKKSEKGPEFFNMSGLTRSSEYMEPGTTYDPDEQDAGYVRLSKKKLQ